VHLSGAEALLPYPLHHSISLYFSIFNLDRKHITSFLHLDHFSSKGRGCQKTPHCLKTPQSQELKSQCSTVCLLTGTQASCLGGAQEQASRPRGKSQVTMPCKGGGPLGLPRGRTLKVACFAFGGCGEWEGSVLERARAVPPFPQTAQESCFKVFPGSLCCQLSGRGRLLWRRCSLWGRTL
jgi:hypothetical protein